MKTMQFESVIKTMLNNALFHVDIEKQINKVINSGAIDIEAIPDNDYTQVKAAAYVIAKSLAEQLRPFSKEGIAEAKNLEKFI